MIIILGQLLINLMYFKVLKQPKFITELCLITLQVWLFAHQSMHFSLENQKWKLKGSTSYNLHTFTCKCWITQKKLPNLMETIFSIYIVYQWPHENDLKKSVRPRKKIEVEGGRLVKKWEFGQTKKNFLYQLFKRKSFALWPMVNFP